MVLASDQSQGWVVEWSENIPAGAGQGADLEQAGSKSWLEAVPGKGFARLGHAGPGEPSEGGCCWQLWQGQSVGSGRRAQHCWLAPAVCLPAGSGFLTPVTFTSWEQLWSWVCAFVCSSIVTWLMSPPSC